MEQLTIGDVIEHCDRQCERYEKFSKHIENCQSYLLENNKYYAEHYYVKEWLQELQRYKDLEEQRLLLKLPCKVGTEVYCINKTRCKHYLSKDCFDCSGDEFANYCYEPDQTIWKYAFVIEMLDELGKTVFLTKVEAEKALKEMKGK